MIEERQLRDCVASLQRVAAAAGTSYADRIAACHPLQRAGAANLVRVAAVAEHCAANPPPDFHAAGFSSPLDGAGDIASHLALLESRLDASSRSQEHPAADPLDATRLIEQHAEPLLGRAPAGRTTRIMVTLGASSALEPEDVRRLLLGGMNVVRINCARDDRAVWSQIIGTVRAEAAQAGRACRVLLDIGGPKLRINSITGGDRSLRVRAGDLYLLCGDGHARTGDASLHDLRGAVGVLQAEVMDRVHAGHAVWIDDGKVGGTVESVLPEGALVRVHTPASGSVKIRLGRSINLPDTDLPFPFLSDKDTEDLLFAREQADLIALSFVRSERDIDAVMRLFAQEQGRTPALVVKVENKSATEHLIEILLSAMRWPHVGVLIARGDLAVECGFDQLPLLQRRLLQAGQAAYLPVFLATGILERLSQKGKMSRAGMIDAYSAAAAQCVMLNRGKHTLQALSVLERLLRLRAQHA